MIHYYYYDMWDHKNMPCREETAIVKELDTILVLKVRLLPVSALPKSIVANVLPFCFCFLIHSIDAV